MTEKRKPGRPAGTTKDNKADALIQIRLPTPEKEAFEQAAQDDGGMSAVARRLFARYVKRR